MQDLTETCAGVLTPPKPCPTKPTEEKPMAVAAAPPLQQRRSYGLGEVGEEGGDGSVERREVGKECLFKAQSKEGAAGWERGSQCSL